MFEHYQFDREAIARAAENIAAVMADRRPDEDPEAFAAQVIAQRLRKAPGDYLQYGPYWWSVKQALRGLGHAFGDSDNAVLREAYGGGLTAHQTLVAGEQFRDYYRAHLMAATSTFALGGDDDAGRGEYTLFDIDMEALRNGLSSMTALNATQVIHDASEQTFDEVHIQFEEDGELWTAVVDGALANDDETAPAALVAELQRSGRIGRAIDRSKGIESVAPDDAGPAIRVDLARRVARIETLPGADERRDELLAIRQER